MALSGYLSRNALLMLNIDRETSAIEKELTQLTSSDESAVTSEKYASLYKRHQTLTEEKLQIAMQNQSFIDNCLSEIDHIKNNPKNRLQG